MPKTKTVFWETKFTRNLARDEQDISGLQDLGWNVMIVWECETRKPDELLKCLTAELTKISSSQKCLNSITEENHEYASPIRETLRVASGEGEKYQA